MNLDGQIWGFGLILRVQIGFGDGFKNKRWMRFLWGLIKMGTRICGSFFLSFFFEKNHTRFFSANQTVSSPESESVEWLLHQAHLQIGPTNPTSTREDFSLL